MMLCVQAFAQNPQGPVTPPLKGIVYNKEFTFGGKLASNGWALTFHTGKILSIYNTRIFEFELADIRHPKEKKQPAEFNLYGQILGNPKDYYFGKQNDFFTLRAGFGYHRNLAEKAEKNGVALSLVYVGGISLGFTKPYYLELAYVTQLDDSTYLLEAKSEKYNENDPVQREKFVNWYEIIGSSGYGKGLKEIRPVPGGYAKMGLNFEWGSRDNFITALEAGFMVDVFYKKVPIMVETPDSGVKNNIIFMQAYVSMHIGKRSR